MASAAEHVDSNVRSMREFVQTALAAFEDIDREVHHYRDQLHAQYLALSLAEDDDFQKEATVVYERLVDGADRSMTRDEFAERFGLR